MSVAEQDIPYNELIKVIIGLEALQMHFPRILLFYVILPSIVLLLHPAILIIHDMKLIILIKWSFVLGYPELTDLRMWGLLCCYG